jgi:hypothetical protein
MAYTLLLTDIVCCTERAGATNVGVKTIDGSLFCNFWRHLLEYVTVMRVTTYRPTIFCVSSCDSVLFNKWYVKKGTRCLKLLRQRME